MDESRPLEGRKPIVDEVYELGRCACGAGIEHDRRADILAEPRMRHGESRRLAYRRMAQQRLFDIVRRYLLAAAVDDFLGAADDGEKAIFVDAADVTGRQPTIPKSAGYAVDVVEKIAGHYARSAQHHLAAWSRPQETAFVIADGKLAFGNAAY